MQRRKDAAPATDGRLALEPVEGAEGAIHPVTVTPAAAPDFPPIGRPAAVVGGRGRGHVDRIAHEVLHVPPYRPDRGNSTVRPALLALDDRLQPPEIPLDHRPHAVLDHYAGTNPSAGSRRDSYLKTDPCPSRVGDDTVPRRPVDDLQRQRVRKVKGFDGRRQATSCPTKARVPHARRA